MDIARTLMQQRYEREITEVKTEDTRVTDLDVPVTTAAGTFRCWVQQVEETTNGAITVRQTDWCTFAVPGFLIKQSREQIDREGRVTRIEQEGTAFEVTQAWLMRAPGSPPWNCAMGPKPRDAGGVHQ